MAASRICSVDGCGKKAKTRGWCNTHYERWRVRGEVGAGRIVSKGEARTFLENSVFYAEDDCLVWPYSRNARGYGLVNIDGNSRLAHRLVCIEVNGPPPGDGYDAAHECGRGHLGCVNPRHLVWKSRSANVADMVRHGTVRRGSKVSTAVLTEDEVRTIRGMIGVRPQAEIARMFGVSPSAICHISQRSTWAHLE